MMGEHWLAAKPDAVHRGAFVPVARVGADQFLLKLGKSAQHHECLSFEPARALRALNSNAPVFKKEPGQKQQDGKDDHGQSE
jgi:hypothetical protein